MAAIIPHLSAAINLTSQERVAEQRVGPSLLMLPPVPLSLLPPLRGRVTAQAEGGWRRLSALRHVRRKDV